MFGIARPFGIGRSPSTIGLKLSIHVHSQQVKQKETHGPQRSPECTDMKAIFSQNTVNVHARKIECCREKRALKGLKCSHSLTRRDTHMMLVSFCSE